MEMCSPTNFLKLSKQAIMDMHQSATILKQRYVTLSNSALCRHMLLIISVGLHVRAIKRFSCKNKACYQCVEWSSHCVVQLTELWPLSTILGSMNQKSCCCNNYTELCSFLLIYLKFPR